MWQPYFSFIAPLSACAADAHCYSCCWQHCGTKSVNFVNLSLIVCLYMQGMSITYTYTCTISKVIDINEKIQICLLNMDYQSHHRCERRYADVKCKIFLLLNTS